MLLVDPQAPSGGPWRVVGGCLRVLGMHRGELGRYVSVLFNVQDTLTTKHNLAGDQSFAMIAHVHIVKLCYCQFQAYKNGTNIPSTRSLGVLRRSQARSLAI